MLGKLAMYLKAKIKQSLRGIKHQAISKVNRKLGKEYIVNSRELLAIDTCSICNLDCRFCAYGKKESLKMEMEDSFFEDLIHQAVELGFDKFCMTPTTGDIFVGKNVLNKLAILENHPKVKSYFFHTNFTLPTESQILSLLDLKKLSELNISWYGHDTQSFIDLTRSTSKVFGRMVDNLKFLLKHWSREKGHPLVNIYLRTLYSFKFSAMDDSELSDIFRELLHSQRIPLHLTTEYNNWGGTVSQADAEGLDIRIDDKPFPKTGACLLIFFSLQVFADGRVNACSCRDVDGKLVIGDLNQEKLKDILSDRNPVYMKLIENQQKNIFHPVCQSCDFYRSIYRGDVSDYYKKPVMNLEEFYKVLSETK
ncbi:MAG: hypothetical protein COV66_08485 [Nitrospinae bacterium CG11_big_fil_rev_8_21_14_0_20_45_15]|nr:MAG: hypothetical protein COV66_08485 [Nitrospinae bacterium CG11_big_fil_rev_8_21_14_0_20_45_15]